MKKFKVLIVKKDDMFHTRVVYQEDTHRWECKLGTMVISNCDCPEIRTDQIYLRGSSGYNPHGTYSKSLYGIDYERFKTNVEQVNKYYHGISEV